MTTKPSETPACSTSELQAIERAESVVTDALAAIRNPYLAGRLDSIRQQLGGLIVVAKMANKVGGNSLAASRPNASGDDLAVLVRKLSYALTKANPGSTLPARAMDYLKRHGLQGSPLRGQDE